MTSPASSEPGGLTDTSSANIFGSVGKLVGRFSDWITDKLIRRLADPAAQRFLTQNMLTRATARRDARALYDICVGFSYSQTLAVCVELDLFETLHQAPREFPELLNSLQLPPDSLQTLLEAAVALKLLRRRHDGKYAVGRLGTAVLADPGIAAIVRHHELLYQDLAQPLQLLQSPLDSRMAAFWSYTQDDGLAKLDGEGAAAYSAVMEATQVMVSNQVVGAVNLSGANSLLDVGCGTGTFARGLMAKHPSLSVTLYDLPPVIELAKANLDATAENNPHLRFEPGDFTAATLPGGHEVISLIRVLHDQDDARALELLKKARAALTPGGKLIVAETLVEDGEEARVGGAYFGWFLLAMGRGRARKRRDVDALLKAAGFSEIRENSTDLPMVVRVITAKF